MARDRIRTVDVTAHLLHRILGVCKVSIGTGRNDLRSGRELPPRRRDQGRGGVAADRAAHRRRRARHRPPSAEDQESRPALAGVEPGVRPVRAPPTAAGQAQVTEILRLQLSWLRFAPLTLTGVVVLGVLFGTVIQITNATEINLAATDPVQHVVTDFTALSVVQRILVGGSVLLACYVLIAMIGYIAVFWNFRLVGLGTDTLRVTRGLLSVRATTISLARLRGVEISESLLLRAARGARCIAIATGLHVGRGAEREGSVLSPPAPRAVALHVATAVLGLPEDLCAGRAGTARPGRPPPQVRTSAGGRCRDHRRRLRWPPGRSTGQPGCGSPRSRCCRPPRCSPPTGTAASATGWPAAGW